MALQSSGAISLADIQTEFGGSNPIGMNEYYRGGSYVPSSVTAVPASGQISMNQFYGTANQSDISFTNYARNTGTADAVFSYRSVTSGIAISSAYLECRLRRTDPYVYLEVRERASNQTSYWWTSAGTQTSLSVSYVTLGRFDLTGITAIRLDWTTPAGGGTGQGQGSCYIAGETNGPSATYNASSGSWVTVANNQSIAFAFTANASAECYNSRDEECTTDITAYARKSGYNDTAMGTYQFTSEAIAISNNCF